MLCPAFKSVKALGPGLANPRFYFIGKQSYMRRKACLSESAPAANMCTYVRLHHKQVVLQGWREVCCTVFVWSCALRMLYTARLIQLSQSKLKSLATTAQPLSRSTWGLTLRAGTNIF